MVAFEAALKWRRLPPMMSNGSPYSLRWQVAPKAVAPQSRECAWLKP